MSVYAKGTIKIADANGNLTAFYPKTDAAAVSMPNGTSLQTEIQSLETRAEEAAGRGSFRVYRTEPTPDNTALESPRTFIGYSTRENDFPALLAKTSLATESSSFTPFSGSGIFAAGETVQISCYLRNSGSADIDNISLVDEYSGIDYSIASFPADAFANSERTITGTVAISAEDVLDAYRNGKTTLDSEIQCTFNGIGETAFIDDRSVLTYSIPVVCENLPELYKPSLTSSYEFYRPSTGTTYSSYSNVRPNLGDEIRISCTVICFTAIPVNNLLIEIPECGFSQQFSLNANESATFTATYTVTESDILEHKTGSTWNANILVTGTSEFGTPISISGRQQIRLQPPIAYLSMQFLSDGLNGAARTAAIVEVGDSISYYGVVRNTGNLTLQNVMMPTDASGEQMENIGSLAPGESKMFAQRSSFSPSTAAVHIVSSSRADADVPENAAVLDVDSYPLRVYSDDYWQITVDTSLNSSSNVTSSVPFNLYPNRYTSSTTRICIDWGDGNTSDCSSSNYSSYRYSANSIHEYSEPGRYTIKVACANWDRLHFATYESNTTSSSYDHLQFIMHFRRTLVSIDRPLPDIYGTYAYSYSTTTTPIATQNSLKSAFESCIALESVAGRLIRTGRIASLAYCFFACKSLPTISEHVFDGMVSATDFSYCFQLCTAFETIPSNLFSGCTAAFTLYSCFRACTALQTIPSAIFSACTAATNFESCFYGCTALTAVPSGMFSECTSATNFSYCFYGCTGIQTLQTGIFSASSSATGFSYCFYGCAALDNIPANLFPANVSEASQNFSYCFYNCTALQTISGDVFARCSSAASFEYCFYNCTSLQTIPQGLFDHNSSATSFSNCFYGCTALETVPSGLFADKTAATSFTYCFCNCTSLQTIPGNLFSGCTAGRYVYRCFQNCSSLQSIPSGLFSSFTAVTSFEYCFYGCTSLQTIPVGLFDANTAVTTFTYCFYGCTSLRTVPVKLFAYNTAVTSFSYCFAGCSVLFNYHLIIGSSVVSSCGSFSTSNIADIANAVDRIICVPSDTCTSYTKFSNVKSTIGAVVCAQNIACLADGYFEFTIDTEAETANAVLGAIPIHPIDTTAGESSRLYIDWGDGTGAEMLPSEIPSPLEHVYETPGRYVIAAGTTEWSNYELETSPNAGGTFKDTLISIDETLPLFGNSSFDNLFCECRHLASIDRRLFWNFRDVESLSGAFKGCESLQTIPAVLLKRQTELLNADSMFEGSGITAVPSGLLALCTKLQSVNSMFKDCANLSYVSEAMLLDCPDIEDSDDLLSGCPLLDVQMKSRADFEAENAIVWLFDPEATSSGGSYIGLPFYLYGRTSSAVFTVDWGDGNSATLSPSSYDTLTPTLPSEHSYSRNIGLYFVTLKSESWESIPIVAMNPEYAAYTYYASHGSLAYFRNTLIEVCTAFPKMNDCECYCSVSSSYSDGTPQYSTAYKFGNSIFCRCAKLRSVPDGLFSKNANAVTFYGAFYNCTSLKTVPSGLFSGCTAVTNFSYCFYGCGALQSIPSGLFGASTAVTTFEYCFQNCKQISSITGSIFANLSSGANFSYCFSGCSALESVSANLFTTSGTCNFQYCFQSCSSLASIPSSLFSTNASSFYYCFAGCSSLASIPSGLFDRCTSVTTYQSCFSGCTLIESIPQGLFDYSPSVTTFARCFYNCTALQALPSGLFDFNTRATTFEGCFFGCDSLQSLPSGLFDHNTLTTTFTDCFRSCDNLQSIPSGLFDNNTAVTTFEGCFFGCYALQEIPYGLFDHNTRVNTFQYCFSDCSSITAIPSGLFDRNTLASGYTFYQCFCRCSSLETVPYGLFVMQTQIGSMLYCFANCPSLGDLDLYIGSTGASINDNYNTALFMTQKTGAVRTIYLPENSSAYTSFSNKTWQDFTVRPFTSASIPEESTTVARTNEHLVYRSDSVANGSTLAIIGKSVLMNTIDVDSSTMTIGAADSNIMLANISTTGNLARTPIQDAFRFICSESIFIERSAFEQTGYNCMQFGLMTSAAEGLTSNAPKSILIDRCTFGDLDNNTLNFYNLAADAVITISNCSFGTVSNAIRISNDANVHFTLNLVNCTFEELDQGDWRGIIICQDYTSSSAEDFAANNRFGPDKITVNVTDCYDPSGSRIEEPADMSQLLGSGSCANPLLYIYADRAGGLVAYDPDVYPTVSILNT